MAASSVIIYSWPFNCTGNLATQPGTTNTKVRIT
jgi:hypothetical protein